MQLLNIESISILSHFDISGNDVNELQFQNIDFISITLLIFHLDILGNDNNEEQLKNIPDISITLLLFHFDISGNDNKYTIIKDSCHINNITCIPF